MIIFLLINLCLVFCGLVESTEYTLDLDSANSSIFTTTSESKDDIRTIVHNVKDGYEVTLVVSEGADLWNAQDKETLVSCTLYLYGDTILMMLDMQSGGKLSQKCYEKNGTEWHAVNDFENRLHHIKETSHTLHLKMLDLDISKTVPNGVEVYRDTWDGVNVSQFTAKYGYSIVSVLDGECSLWTAGLNERCLEVWIHSTGTSSICRMDLMDKDNVIWPGYLEKNGGKWTVIDHCTYQEKHKNMLNSRAIRMNPAHVDPSLRTCKSCVQDGSFCCINSICSDYNVSTISFNGQTFWESKDHKCTEMTAFCKNGTHYFELNMKNGQEESTDQKLYYSLSKGECTVIDKNAYDEGRKRADDPQGNSISHRMNITGNPDPLYVRAHVCVNGGMTTKTFIPQPGSSIKFVTQHALILWEAGEDSKARCTGVTCTLVNKLPTFLKMDIEEDSNVEHKFMQMENGKDYFTEITERDYTSRLACCKECTPCEHDDEETPPPPKPFPKKHIPRPLEPSPKKKPPKRRYPPTFPRRHIPTTMKPTIPPEPSPKELAPTVEEPTTLDIANPDESKVTIYARGDDRLQYKDYYVKDGVRVTSVVENGMLIWREENKRCLYVETSSMDNDIVLSLCTYADGQIDFKNFIKEDGSWKEVDQETLSKKYWGMKNESTMGQSTDSLDISEEEPDYGITENISEEVVQEEDVYDGYSEGASDATDEILENLTN